MHAGDFAELGYGEVYIQALALVDKRPTVGGHVDYLFLRYLPNRFVKVLDVFWNAVNVLQSIPKL